MLALSKVGSLCLLWRRWNSCLERLRWWSRGDSWGKRIGLLCSLLGCLVVQHYTPEVSQFAPQNRPVSPKGKDRLPTIIFQGICWTPGKLDIRIIDLHGCAVEHGWWNHIPIEVNEIILRGALKQLNIWKTVLLLEGIPHHLETYKTL